MSRFGSLAISSAIAAVLGLGVTPAMAVPLLSGLNASNQLIVADKTFTFTSCTPVSVGSTVGTPCAEMGVTPIIQEGPNPLDPYDDLYGFKLNFFIAALSAGSSRTVTIEYTVDVAPGSLIADAHLDTAGGSPFATVDEVIKHGSTEIAHLFVDGVDSSDDDFCLGSDDLLDCVFEQHISGTKVFRVAYDDVGHKMTQMSIISELFSQVPGNTTNAPEPMTLALFGAGLAGIGALRRRKNKAKPKA